MKRKTFIKQIMGNYLLDRNTAASMAKTSRQRGASYADSLRRCYEIYCYFCHEAMVRPFYTPMYGSFMECSKHLAITGLDERIPSADQHTFKPMYRLDTKPLEVRPVMMWPNINTHLGYVTKLHLVDELHTAGGGGHE